MRRTVMSIAVLLCVAAMPATSSAGERQSPLIQQLGIYAEVAVRTPDNALQRYMATSPAWTPDLLAGPGSTFSSPRITEVNGSAHILVQGPYHSLMQYVSSPMGWIAYQIAGVDTTFSDPVLEKINGYLMTFVRGANNTLMQYVAAPGGWVSYQVAGPGSAFSSPRVTMINGEAHLAVQGPNNSLMQYHATSNGWNAYQIAGANTTYSEPEIQAIDGNLMVVVRGPGNTLMQYHAATGGWNAYQIAGANSTFSSPRITPVNGVLNVIVRGADNTLMQYASATGGWNAFQISGPDSTHSNPVLQVVNGSPMIVVEGPQHRLMQYIVSSNGWSSYQIAGPGAIGSPYATSLSYGGYDDSVNTDEEMRAVFDALAGAGTSAAGSLLDGLSPDDRSRFDQYLKSQDVYAIDAGVTVGDTTPVAARDADPDANGQAAAAGSSGCRWMEYLRDMRLGFSEERSIKIGWVKFRSRFCWNRIAHTTWANDRYFEMSSDIYNGWEIAGYKVDTLSDRVSYNVGHLDGSGRAWPRGGVHMHMRYQAGHCTPGASIVIGCTNEPIRTLINYGYFNGRTHQALG